VNVGGIPDALKHEPRWMLWRFEWDQKRLRWTKVPYRAGDTSKKASSTDSRTWSTFADALCAYQRGGVDGIGFALGDSFFGLDMDDCLVGGQLAPAARSYAEQLDTYAEISPGGDGLHLIGRGRKPGGGCCVTQNGVKHELYDCGRYLTITGQPVDGLSRSVEERQSALDAVYAQLFGTTNTKSTPSITGGHTTAIEDDVLLQRAFASRNGPTLRRMYDGDSTGYKSISEADAAFCRSLAFWTARNVAQMDRLFRRSQRMRDKWDEPRGTTTYGERTLRWAVNITNVVYDSSHH